MLSVAGVSSGTYVGNNLELLALAVLGLGDGLLQARDGLVVELLRSLVST